MQVKSSIMVSIMVRLSSIMKQNCRISSTLGLQRHGQQLKHNAGQVINHGINHGKAFINNGKAKLQDFHTRLQRHGQQLKHNAGQVINHGINHGKAFINNGKAKLQDFHTGLQRHGQNVQTKDDTNIPAQYTGLQGERERILLNAMQKWCIGKEPKQLNSYLKWLMKVIVFIMEEYASGAKYEGRADFRKYPKRRWS